MNTTKYTRYEEERGIVLILGGLFIASLTFIILALVFDVLQSKQARVIADRIALQVCRAGLESMPIVPNALEQIAYRALQEQSIPGKVSISQIRVIVPSVEGDPADPSSPPYLDTNDADASALIMNFPNCPNCKVGGNVEDTSLDEYYPQSNFWSQAEHNQYIACEVKLAVDGFVSNDHDVQGKAVYRFFTPNESFEGLIVGIAPELRVKEDPIDRRFLFSQTQNFAFDPFDLSPKVPFRFAQQAQSGAWGTIPRLPALAPATPNSREIVAHVMNPYLAVRNTFLESLVARFTRLEMYRKRTQMLLIPPYNAPYSYPTSGSVDPNPPVQLVGYGEDLASPFFRLPAMNVKPPTFNPLAPGSDKMPVNNAGGYLCPFEDCTTGFSRLDAIQHRITMMQHADSWHAYFPDANPNEMIFTVEDAVVNHPDQASFEPQQSGYFVARDSVAPEYTPGSGAGRAQSFFAGAEVTQGMTAQEAVRVLGTFESCPYNLPGSAYSCNKGFNPNDSDLTTGNDPTYRGDIHTFLRYVSGELNGSVQAYGYPGNLMGPNPTGSFGTQPVPANRVLMPTELRNSAVLLITSKRLESAQEIAAIGAVVDTMLDREITVVFLPTSDADTNSLVEQNFNQAFRTDATDNRVYVIQPDNTFPGCSGPALDGTCFQGYWEALLTGTAPSISSLAERIFLERFIQSEVVL
ncbi:MAG: hypothetical protein KDD55_10355 [Bdellovibrionales bacterium]|nr:hypothetical protein [Bdellovibrionales bacterium]